MRESARPAAVAPGGDGAVRSCKTTKPVWGNRIVRRCGQDDIQAGSGASGSSATRCADHPSRSRWPDRRVGAQPSHWHRPTGFPLSPARRGFGGLEPKEPARRCRHGHPASMIVPMSRILAIPGGHRIAGSEEGWHQGAIGNVVAESHGPSGADAHARPAQARFPATAEPENPSMLHRNRHCAPRWLRSGVAASIGLLVTRPASFKVEPVVPCQLLSSRKENGWRPRSCRARMPGAPISKRTACDYGIQWTRSAIE